MQHLAKDIFDLVSPDNSVSFLLSAQLPRSLFPLFLPHCNVPPPGVCLHTSLQDTYLSQHPLNPAWNPHEGHVWSMLSVACDPKAKAGAEVSEPLFPGARLFCPLVLS